MDESFKMEVPPEILAQTTRCEKGFCCLSQMRVELCKVEYYAEYGVLLIRCATPKPCPYKMPYGHAWICTCPTRLAIFKRYHV
jgi:hypothetical protein